MKPILMVSMELNDRFAALERSLASLVKCIDKLAKRLNSPKPMVSQPSPKCQPLVISSSQNQRVDIVISEGSGVTTSGKTIAEVACGSLLLAMFRVSMSLLSRKNFDGMCIFTSGLDIGFFGAEVAIIMDNLLVQHVSKVEEVPGCAILVCLFFKGKVSVSVVDLYACVSPSNQFRQVPSINFFIVWMVNSSSFVVLGSDFNEGKSKKSASFSFCLSLGLVNFFGTEKVIDHIFINGSLISVAVSCRVESVTEFFDTDHRAVLVSMSLGGFLDMCLDDIHRNAIKNHWKFKLKNVDTNGWEHFMECSSAKFLKRSGVFHNAEHSGDLNGMWNVLRNVIIDSANVIFSRLWFSEFDSMRNRASSRFHGLEMLMSKIVNSMKTGLSLETGHFVRVMIDESAKTEDIVHHISVVKKEYHRSKYYESRVARDESIRVAVAKCMENFCSNKRRMIKNILDRPFKKVVLDHLIVDDELILEPQAVKFSVDTIMESWMRKHLVSNVLPDWWLDQYALLDYVNNNMFSEVMCDISLDELLVVVKKLSNSKAAGLSGISNELWKHSGSLALNSLLNILNRCLKSGSVSTQPIVFIETAWKILSKILSNRIFLACSKYDILHDDNFSVLKNTSTQSPIFTVNSIVEDALEKNRELWLVLQDMHKAYNSVMTDFGLSDGYIVHDVKKHEQLYGYRMCSKFYTKSGKANSSSNSTSFFVAASEFFFINDILINADKTVTILINQGVWNAKLFISGSRISVTKKGDSYQYLEIFLSTEGLSKLSLAKIHADIRFFLNVVLRKAITKKQFLYLVSANKLLRKRLKLKTNLPKDFPSVTLHHLMLYGLKPFEQVLTESLMANLGNKLTGSQLDALILFPFSASVTHALTLCNTFLDSALPNIFRAGFGVLILDVLGVSGYLVFGSLSNNEVVAFCSAPANVVWDTGFVSEQLLATRHGSIDVYMNGSVKSLGSIGACSGAAAYFLKANKKVKEHSGVIENEHRNFVRKLFNAVNFVGWESKFGTSIVDINFAGDVNSSKSFSVWYPNGGIRFGYTSLSSASLQSYLMKSLHCYLPVAIRKRLYNPKYPSMVCIRCGMVEESDHLFLCKHNNVARLDILLNIGMEWCKMAGDSALGSRVMQFLSKAKSSGSLYMLLAKEFVLKSWVSDAVLCLDLTSGGSLIVKLVYNIAKSYRLNIWLPAAKLRAFYEKHNFLPWNESAVLLVDSLSSL
ncbi:hypothetical protein G9A89_015552 [Geosiphon pyriformis]|nr:hypothetical protein G9A89_015552 [Geosiphon pyriformis]